MFEKTIDDRVRNYHGAYMLASNAEEKFRLQGRTVVATLMDRAAHRLLMRFQGARKRQQFGKSLSKRFGV